MMNQSKNNKEVGKIGEDYAIQSLLHKGYEILETNYRASHAEIDIIAKDGDILVFVEVKTRAYEFYGRPEEFVSTRQQECIFFAANRYMEKIQYDWEIRFDIIALIMKLGCIVKSNHFKDAFFPGIQ